MNKKILSFFLSIFILGFLTSFAQTLNEGFEDPTFPPAGWHTKNILGGVIWMRATGIAHSGSYSAIIAWETSGGEDWLVTPQLSILAGDSLKFWARRYWPAIYHPDSLDIRISTSDTSASSFTTVLAAYDVNTFPNPDFGEYKIDLSGFTNQNIYIAFRHFDINGNGMYLDDISVSGGVVPVELSGFTALVSENDVTLTWTTATEINNSGFYIERREGEESWNNIGFVEGLGTNTEIQSYTFIDKDLTSGIYSYRIRQVDFDGNFEYYELDQEIVIEVPNAYTLSQNYPNPFNPTTNINYQIKEKGFVSLKVFDMLGREVAILLNETQDEGQYSVVFNAGNLPSGVYVYSLRVNDFIHNQKMTLLK